MKIPISVSLDEGLLKLIDRNRGMVSRSAFIEYKLKEAVGKVETDGRE